MALTEHIHILFKYIYVFLFLNGEGMLSPDKGRVFVYFYLVADPELTVSAFNKDASSDQAVQGHPEHL